MKAYVVLISLVAACGGLLFGFDTAVISGVIPFIRPYFALSEAGVGWAVSSVILGCILGTQLAGRPADRYGRKKTLIFTALLFFISAIGSALSGSFATFVLFRVAGGIAVGGASVLSPIYIAEVAPAQYRGRLVAANQLTLVIGILLAFFTNYLLAGLHENNWRWMLGIMAVPAFVFFVMLLVLPESPRWLFIKGRRKECEKVLRKLSGPEQATAAIKQMEASGQTKKVRIVLNDLFTRPYKRLLILGIVLALLQQFTGINIIMYYAPVIFEASGAGISHALLQTISIGVINLLATVLAMFVVDKIGRKPLLVYGQLAMAIFMAVLSATYLLDYMERKVVIIAILSFIASFALTSGPVTWVLISEIYPNHIRGTAVSIATFFLWVAAFLVSYSFPIMLKHWHGGVTFLFYALINLGGFFFVKTFLQETKGKSLEELEAMTIKP